MRIRTRLSSYIGIALAMLAGMHVPRLPANDPTPGTRSRRGGKGKGRLGARKAFHAPQHGRRVASKPARRRRAKLHLRRG